MKGYKDLKLTVWVWELFIGILLNTCAVLAR